MKDKEQERYPATGWVAVKNATGKPLTVLIEPWGVGPMIRPEDECRIFIAESYQHLPEIQISDDVVSIYAATSIVEVNGDVTHDFSDNTG